GGAIPTLFVFVPKTGLPLTKYGPFAIEVEFGASYPPLLHIPFVGTLLASANALDTNKLPVFNPPALEVVPSYTPILLPVELAAIPPPNRCLPVHVLVPDNPDCVVLIVT